MNRIQQSVPVVIPPALDADESELAARNEFLAEKDKSGADDSDALLNACARRNDGIRIWRI